MTRIEPKSTYICSVFPNTNAPRGAAIIKEESMRICRSATRWTIKPVFVYLTIRPINSSNARLFLATPKLSSMPTRRGVITELLILPRSLRFGNEITSRDGRHAHPPREREIRSSSDFILNPYVFNSVILSRRSWRGAKREKKGRIGETVGGGEREG